MLNSNFSLNNTTIEDSKCQFSIYFKVILCTLIAVTGICSLIENILFCVIVYLNKKLQIKSSILIVSLSITDIIIGSTVPVFEFMYLIYNPRWPLGSLGTNIQNAFWLFSLVMPFVTVTAITIDRYLAITKSFRYGRFITASKLLFVVGCLYLYSFIWVLCMALNFLPTPEDVYTWNVPSTTYYVFLAIHIVFLLILIPVLYRKIAKTVKLSRQNTGVVQVRRSEIKLAKTVAFVTGFLFLVWAPVVVLEIFYNLNFLSCIIEQAGTVSVWFTCVNGALNPIVYSYRNEEVHKYIVKMYSCFRKETLDDYPRNQQKLMDQENQASSFSALAPMS